jgi:hypothetical protein
MKSATFDVAPQADGRKWVTYTFVTDVGETFTQLTLQAGDSDPVEQVAARAQDVESSLRSCEATNNAELILIGRDAETAFRYSTLDDARALIRSKSADILATAQSAANSAVAAAAVDPTLVPAVAAAAAEILARVSDDG